MPVVCFGRNVGECWRIHRLKPVRSLCYQEAFMIVPLTPVRCLYRGVDLYGKKVGVVSGASRATYAQFGERCERLAAGIVAEGILPGDRVAYLSFNNNALLEGYYGVVLARGVVMPLNVRLTPLELVAILNHSEARMLIFENDFTPLVEHIRKACPAIARYVGITEAGDGGRDTGGAGGGGEWLKMRLSPFPTTALLADPMFREHLAGRKHPERPERVR